MGGGKRSVFWEKRLTRLGMAEGGERRTGLQANTQDDE